MFGESTDCALVSSLAVQPDVSRPRWPQASFTGRAKHFFSTVNPLNCFISNDTLEKSRQIITDYKGGHSSSSLTVGELWRAKEVFDSAFHPVTGEKMTAIGRMSSQVPCNMILNGGMLTFRSHLPSVVFWHWLNQSFNAVVNYTNRSGEDTSTRRLFFSYCCATGGALTAALGLNALTKDGAGLRARLIPFGAVAIANAINIPMMRSKELECGIVVRDEEGIEVGKSRRAATVAITQVTLSRIAMAASTMVSTPIIMMLISKKNFYQARPWLAAPLQTLIAGFTLTFATPLCCAIFPQTGSIEVAHLEDSIREKIALLPNPPTVVYYNKGL